MLNPTMITSKALNLKCSDGVNKNWPLGHGQYTLSGNLGPLVPYVADAKANGFDDVLWMLDDYVQEMTILNVFFLIMNRYGKLELATPADNGCILPGFIRNTILELKDEIEKETGMLAQERPISIHEIFNANDEGRLIEAFGCSTASLIQPISKIVHRDQVVALNTDKDGQYVNYLNRKIVDLMKGPDTHPWVTSLEDD